MNFHRFVSVKLTFFLIIGILLGAHTDIGPLFALLSAVIFLGLLGTIFFLSPRPNPIVFGSLVALTTLSTGLSAYVVWQPKNQKDHYSHFIHNGNQDFRLKIREVLKSNSFQNRYIARVEKYHGKPTSGKILLSMPRDSTQNTFNIDDELIVFGQLREIREPMNPNQFNYRQYMRNLGITHRFTGSAHNHVLSPITAPTFVGHAAKLRSTLMTKLGKSRFGTDEFGILQALLVGQRNHISPETYETYKNAGAVHILAVSGLHIGILLLVLQFLLRPLERLPKGKTLKLITLIALLWCFALLSGLSPSVIRAVSMFSFVGYALYLNRPSNTFNILALSMFFILLLFNPMFVSQVGFQMSYAAVFSIIWIYPMLQRFWFPKNLVVRKVWQLLSVSFAAQIGVLPISLFYFHQFPGLFFVSNLIVVPFLGFLLGSGIVVLFLAACNVLPDCLATGYSQLVGLMNSVIGWIAGQEAFVFKNIPFDGMQLVLAYSIIVTLLLLVTKSLFVRVVSLLLSIIAFELWILQATLTTTRKQEVLLLHQNNNSVLLHQKGTEISIHTTDPDRARVISQPLITTRRLTKSSYYGLLNSYHFKGGKVLIIDSTGVIPDSGAIDYLILTQSAKVNLARVLNTLRPKEIIADGSNYPSVIQRWKETCAQSGLPFHYTGDQGAFYFK